MVSEEVKLVFEMPLADKVWSQLEILGLNSKELESHFQGYYAGVRRTNTYAQPKLIFLEWGEWELQPKINRKLKRDHGHPTFNAMMEYLLHTEIEKYKMQYPDIYKTN